MSSSNEERNTPVSFKLPARIQKALKQIAVDNEVSMSDIIEWYCATVVEMGAAHQLGLLSKRGHTLVLASLDEPTHAALRALALREGNTTWQVARRAIETEVGRREAHDPIIREAPQFVPPCSPDAWAGVVAAVSAALREGTDPVDAFYRAFPWNSVPADVDDAALLAAALGASDTGSVVRTRFRRMYSRSKK